MSAVEHISPKGVLCLCMQTMEGITHTKGKMDNTSSKQIPASDQ